MVKKIENKVSIIPMANHPAAPLTVSDHSFFRMKQNDEEPVEEMMTKLRVRSKS